MKMKMKIPQLPIFLKDHIETHNFHGISRLKCSTENCYDSSANRHRRRGYKYAKSFYSYLFILIGFLSFFEAKSQDPFFLESQQIKGYLNPALTGINGSLSFKVLVKDQFWKTNKFITGGLSVEQSFPCHRIDIGAYCLYDVEGDGFLKTMHCGASGVYIIPLYKNNHNIHNFRGGIKISHTYKSINWDKLYFSDQINKKYGLFNSAGVPNITSFSPTGLGGSNYTIISGGFAYKSVVGKVNKYRFTAGFAFDNITTLFQDRGFDSIFELEQEEGIINKYSIYFSTELPFVRKLNDKLSFNPSLIYQRQRTLSNLQIGFMLNYGKLFDSGVYLNFGDFENLAEDNKMLIGVVRLPLKSTFSGETSITIQYAHNIGPLDDILGQTIQVTLSYLFRKDGCNSTKVNIQDCYDFIKGEVLYEDAFLRPVNGINK